MLINSGLQYRHSHTRPACEILYATNGIPPGGGQYLCDLALLSGAVLQQQRAAGFQNFPAFGCKYAYVGQTIFT